MTNSETAGERLGIYLRSKRYTNKWFADKIGLTPGMISAVLNGRSDITGTIYGSLIKLFPDLNLDWLGHGRGEMLYTPAAVHESDNIAPSPDIYFNRNLPALMRAYNTDVDNLSLLIGEPITYITDLVNGTRGPSLRIVLRLRDVWGVDVGALLFADLTLPGAMEELQETTANNLSLQQQINAVLKRLEKLEEEGEKKPDNSDQPKTPKIDKD